MYNKDIFNNAEAEPKKTVTLNAEQIEGMRKALIDNFSSLNDKSLTSIVDVLSQQGNQNPATSNFLGSLDTLLGGGNNQQASGGNPLGALGSLAGSVLGGNSKDNNSGNALGALGALGSLAGSVLGGKGNSNQGQGNPLGSLLGSVLGNSNNSAQNPIMNLIKSQLPGILKSIDPKTLLSIFGALKNIDPNLVTKILAS